MNTLLYKCELFLLLFLRSVITSLCTFCIPHQVNIHLEMFLDCTTCVGYTMNCACLFSPLIGTKFVGLHYHSLLIHGPVQYEIVYLHSVNTEAKECMFNSVKVVADHPIGIADDDPQNPMLLYPMIMRVTMLTIMHNNPKNVFKT